jgi:peptidoglycan/xylan/chitin deacetylase (PgdA/CDA1 family)
MSPPTRRISAFQEAKAALRNRLIRTMAPLSDRLYREKPRTRVIAIHDISPACYKAFEKKMRWLLERFQLVSLNDIEQQSGLDFHRLNIGVTFDDAFKEHATFVAPLLADMGIPATFFIPSGVIGLEGDAAKKFSLQRLRRSRSFEFMNEKDLKNISQNSLFEIGSHTTDHADLGIMTDEEKLRYEILHDKNTLEGMTGRPVQRLAFPFGGYGNVSPQALNIIQAAGFRSAFTIVPSFWSRERNLFLIGRDSLSVELGDHVWDGLLRGGYDSFSFLKGRKKLRSLTRHCRTLEYIYNKSRPAI